MNERKTARIRRLLVSSGDFVDDGLLAFGQCRGIICMDVLGLYEMLDRESPFTQVLEPKARRTAETC